MPHTTFVTIDLQKTAAAHLNKRIDYGHSQGKYVDQSRITRCCAVNGDHIQCTLTFKYHDYFNYKKYHSDARDRSIKMTLGEILNIRNS